ncbi:unnamed protein product [Dicrocoelium dendriticum]|nr:unnamed protein product [Dicrocoelium dendriticum]
MRSLFRFIAVASALSLLSFLLTYRQLQRNVTYVLPLFAPPRLPSKAIVNCTHATCFNASLCAREHRDRPLNRISVFVYHPTVHVYDSGQHINLETSNEQFELLSTIRASRYATDNPFEACVFVPSVDLLNGFDSYANLSLRILTALPWWNNGANHLIFSILPGRRHQFSGLAISASAAHFMPAYRPTFDISIPAFNPMRGVDYDAPVPHARHLLTILPTYSQADLPGLKLLLSSYRESSFCQNVSVLMFDRPDTDRPLSSYDDFRSAFLSTTPYKQAIRTTTPYIKALSESLFCAIIRISAVGQIAVFDAMSTGCIPIIADDRYVLPFSEVLDWSKFSVRVRATELHSIPSLLASFGADDVARFQRQLQFVFLRYFSSMSKIAMTTLDIINDRVFPYYSRSYAEWNNPDYRQRLFPIQPLIFYPTRSALGTGFTLLVRGHHHFSLLHELLIRLNSIPLLRRIVVVWTNRNIPAPNAALWPSLSVPLSLVHANDVNGRYFPFPLIETEAVLSLEDHNCAPSVEQIQLAFEL